MFKPRAVILPPVPKARLRLLQLFPLFTFSPIYFAAAVSFHKVTCRCVCLYKCKITKGGCGRCDNSKNHTTMNFHEDQLKRLRRHIFRASSSLMLSDTKNHLLTNMSDSIGCSRCQVLLEVKMYQRCCLEWDKVRREWPRESSMMTIRPLASG